MSFIFNLPAPKSPIIDFDHHELATVVRGTTGTTAPDIANLASDFVLHFKVSGRQFMELGDSIINTLSNSDPNARERLCSLQTSRPEHLKALLRVNTPPPSRSNSFSRLAPAIREIRASHSSAAIGSHGIADSSEEEGLDKPFVFEVEDSSKSDELDEDDPTQELDVEPIQWGYDLVLRNFEPVLNADVADEQIVNMDATSQVDIHSPFSFINHEERDRVSTENVAHPALFLSTQHPISDCAERQTSFQDRNSAQPHMTITNSLIFPSPVQCLSGPRRPNRDEETTMDLIAVAEEGIVNEGITSEDDTNSTISHSLSSGVYLIHDGSLTRDKLLHINTILSGIPEEPIDVGDPFDKHFDSEPHYHAEPQNESIIPPTTVIQDTEFTATLSMLQNKSVTSIESDIFHPVTYSSIGSESERNVIRRPSLSCAMVISTTSSRPRIILTSQVAINNTPHEGSPSGQTSSDPILTGRSTSSIEAKPPLPAFKGNDDILGALSPLLVDFSFEPPNSHNQPLVDVANTGPSEPLALEGPGGRTDLDEDDDANASFLTIPSSPDAPGQPIVPATPQTIPSHPHDPTNSSTRIVDDSDTPSVSMLAFIEKTLSSNLRNPTEPLISGGSSSPNTPLLANIIKDTSRSEIVLSYGHRYLGPSSPSSSLRPNLDEQPADRLSLPILVLDPPNASGTDSTMEMKMKIHSSIQPSKIFRHEDRTRVPSSPILSTLVHRSEGSPPKISSAAAADDIPVLRVAVVGDHIKPGIETETRSSPSPFSDTADVSDSSTLAVSIADEPSAPGLQLSCPITSLLGLGHAQPCTLGNWSNASRRPPLTSVEVAPPTASCSLSVPRAAFRHTAEHDNLVLPESPPRTIVIHSEDQSIMTPEIMPGILLPNDTTLRDNHGTLFPSCQPASHGCSTQYHPVFRSLSESPMANHGRQLAGADDKNTSLIAVELSSSENGANMVYFSQGPFSVKEANFEVGSMVGFRPVIDVDRLGSEGRFKVATDSRSDSLGRPGTQEYDTTESSSEKHEFSLPTITSDRSFSQEIFSSFQSLSFDLPANPCHNIAEAPLMPTVLTSPQRLSRATPRTLWPVSDYVYEEGRPPVLLLDNDKPDRKCRTSRTLPVSGSSSKSRDELVSPPHVDVAIQTDTDCQRQLSHIQTREQILLSPARPSQSPLSALLPKKGVILEVFQKVFADLLPKDTASDMASYSKLRPRPRVDVTPGGLLPTFQGPLSAISRNGDI
ncbi:hypothetical protein GALMADRAFT_223933 [Galerina marginata CBS 339.88]|uniref:Uncharacterized protein n=1 Tax=Galerina marginata (strain CBS 339.88) TaxID=685588 RepID=A0A067TFI3_GALM3|nr:hypothetical protein GALMADRAFT_223933 [Galerina marginata CBS 339.88]